MMEEAAEDSVVQAVEKVAEARERHQSPVEFTGSKAFGAARLAVGSSEQLVR